MDKSYGRLNEPSEKSDMTFEELPSLLNELTLDRVAFTKSLTYSVHFTKFRWDRVL